MERHVRSLAALSAVGACLVSATFLPWVRSGSRPRSSYDLLGLLDRLGLAGDGPVAAVVRWWPVVPLLVTAAVVLAWWGHHGWALVSAAISAVYVEAVAIVIIIAAARSGIDLGVGIWVAIVAAALLPVAAARLRLTVASDLAR